MGIQRISIGRIAMLSAVLALSGFSMTEAASSRVETSVTIESNHSQTTINGRSVESRPGTSRVDITTHVNGQSIDPIHLQTDESRPLINLDRRTAKHIEGTRADVQTRVKLNQALSSVPSQSNFTPAAPRAGPAAPIPEAAPARTVQPPLFERVSTWLGQLWNRLNNVLEERI